MPTAAAAAAPDGEFFLSEVGKILCNLDGHLIVHKTGQDGT